MEVYRVQLRVGNYENEDEDEWRDLYLDLSSVFGWYLPDLNEKLGPGVIVFTPAGDMYLKQEAHLLRYLKEKLFTI